MKLKNLNVKEGKFPYLFLKSENLCISVFIKCLKIYHLTVKPPVKHPTKHTWNPVIYNHSHTDNFIKHFWIKTGWLWKDDEIEKQL